MFHCCPWSPHVAPLWQVELPDLSTGPCAWGGGQRQATCPCALLLTPSSLLLPHLRAHRASCSLVQHRPCCARADSQYPHVCLQCPHMCLQAPPGVCALPSQPRLLRARWCTMMHERIPLVHSNAHDAPQCRPPPQNSTICSSCHSPSCLPHLMQEVTVIGTSLAIGTPPGLW